MTSERKKTANRGNARMSTGPRSRAGKARASRNAFRHGLATGVYRLATAASEIEQIAEGIASSFGLNTDVDAVRVAAEATFELARIRKIRSSLTIGSMNTPEEISEVMKSIQRLERYEHRALSRRKRAIRSIVLS